MNQIIDLGGLWQFRERHSETWKLGQVPGCVQLDLLNQGELNDPYYRLNEHEYHELEEKEWVYRKAFTWGNDVDGVSAVNLVFEGIDTLADVYLNGEHLARVQDMFVSYRFDVKHRLVPGENTIEVHFESPVEPARMMAKNSPVRLIGTPEPGRPFVRKAQYSYGWNWGPRITQTGLLKTRV